MMVTMSKTNNNKNYIVLILCERVENERMNAVRRMPLHTQKRWIGGRVCS